MVLLARTRAWGAGCADRARLDLTGSWTNKPSDPLVSELTGYSYDIADRLTRIDPPGSSPDVGFTLDALGRNKTRVIGTTSDTYRYLGESESVVRVQDAAGGTIDAALTSSGDRIATKQGTAFGWSLPDLHGSVAAMLSSDGSAVTNAFRYDAYGELTPGRTYTAGGSVATPWRYQGNLLLSGSADADLYENGARAYDPGLGAFTQLGTAACDASGQATRPAWSPDGSQIAFLASPSSVGVEGFGRLNQPYELYLMDGIERQPRILLRDIRTPRQLEWSPDGPRCC